MKIGDKLICKKSYFYNGNFYSNDIFIVVGFNEYNIRLKTKYDTYHNIRHCSKQYNELYFYDLFYTQKELRKNKLEKLN
jgi:hypothetical protein